MLLAINKKFDTLFIYNKIIIILQIKKNIKKKKIKQIYTRKNFKILFSAQILKIDFLDKYLSFYIKF